MAENKAKLEEVRTKFNDLDALLNPEMDKLDANLADLLSAAIKAFLEMQVKALQGQLENVEAALAGTAVAEAVAAAPADVATPAAQ